MDFLCVTKINSQIRFIHNKIFPEWQMLDFFVVDIIQFVFRVDSNEFAQPMTHYVEHPIDIDFHFNSINYSKGWFAFCILFVTLTQAPT